MTADLHDRRNTDIEVTCTTFLLWKHLPGVHDPVRIEQFLDLFHPFDARLILTIFQRACFRVSDTMFSRDGPIVRS